MKDAESNVVSLEVHRAKKEAPALLENMYQMQDDLLDAMEEVFPEGCVLVALGEQGELTIASSLNEQDDIVFYLMNAIQMITEKE